MLRKEEILSKKPLTRKRDVDGDWFSVFSENKYKQIIDEIFSSIGSCGECEYYNTKVCPYDIECNPPEDFYCKNFKRKEDV